MFNLRKDWRTSGCYKNNLRRINLVLVTRFPQKAAFQQSQDAMQRGLIGTQAEWLLGIKLVQEIDLQKY